MYCSNCKKTLPQGMTFCDTCGSRLEPDNDMNSFLGTNQSAYAGGATYQASQNTQSFTPPPYPMSAQSTANNHVSTGKWIGIFLINLIPFVGPLIYLIMLFVWAFGSCKYPSLKSFAKAMLILMLIGIILAILVAIFLAPIMTNLFDGLNFDYTFDY